MSMDRQDNLLSMDLVRFMNFVNEFERTNIIPHRLLEQPHLANELIINQLKSLRPDQATVVDRMMSEYRKNLSCDSDCMLTVVKLTFNEFHHKMLTMHLDIVPPDILSQFRDSVNPVVVMYIEGRVLLKLVEHEKYDPARFDWISDIVNDHDIRDTILDAIDHDISLLNQFMIWYNGGPGKDFEYPPSQVYYASRLIEDLRDYKKVFKSLISVLEKGDD